MFHFHEKHKAVCIPLRAYTLGKFGTYDVSFHDICAATLQCVRGLEGNISIDLCVVLFITSHSAAIGKELKHLINQMINFIIKYKGHITKMLLKIHKNLSKILITDSTCTFK